MIPSQVSSRERSKRLLGSGDDTSTTSGTPGAVLLGGVRRDGGRDDDGDRVHAERTEEVLKGNNESTTG
jgi:hypothetical protein